MLRSSNEALRSSSKMLHLALLSLLNLTAREDCALTVAEVLILLLVLVLLLLLLLLVLLSVLVLVLVVVVLPLLLRLVLTSLLQVLILRKPTKTASFWELLLCGEQKLQMVLLAILDRLHRVLTAHEDDFPASHFYPVSADRLVSMLRVTPTALLRLTSSSPLFRFEKRWCDSCS